MAPPKRPWFRFYTEAIRDPKLRRLPPGQRWAWVAVLALARQSPIPGLLVVAVGDDHLVPLTEADLADAAGIRPSEAKAALAAFEQMGMVHRNIEGGAHQVTNWDGRQFETDDVAARTRKARVSNKTNSGLPATTALMERSNDNDGTFHSGTMERSNGRSWNVDGTPPENREQRTESSSSRSDSRDTARACDDDPRIKTAISLIADQRINRLATPPADPRRYRTTVLADVRRDVGHDLATDAAALPDATPAELAHRAEPPTPARPAAPADPLTRTVQAQRAIADRNARRQRGETCPTCDDLGVTEQPDGSYNPCPTCT